MLLVQDFLHESAEQRPDKLALICDGQRLTYAELDAMANRFANALLQNGLRRGERVVIFLPNSVELVVGILGTLKAGGVFVMVNQLTKPDKLAFIVNDCGAFAVVTGDRQLSVLDAVAGEMPSLQYTVVCGAKAAQHITDGRQAYDAIQRDFSVERPVIKTIDVDLACLLYTSGSTGEPKGVMCDHSNMVFVSDSVIAYLENTEDDILCCTLPLSFGYGLYQAFMAFRFGGTLVLERGFTFPAAVLKRMAAEKVTGIPIVPTMMATLLKMDLSHYDLSSLRYITNAAAALPPSHLKAFNEQFPQVTIFSMYGMTETKRALYLPPEQLANRPDSVGIAIPGTEVWLVDEDDNRITTADEVGELVVRGRHVMRGYWNLSEKTAKKFRLTETGERICYSGDLFRMDDEGYLYFVSRKDDVIKSRGEKVAPKEIENTVYKIDSVREAAAIGVDDEMLGQAIKLFVVTLDENLTARDVQLHCRQYLEDFMIPKYVEFRDELPKTSSGKIRKVELD